MPVDHDEAFACIGHGLGDTTSFMVLPNLSVLPSGTRISSSAWVEEMRGGGSPVQGLEMPRIHSYNSPQVPEYRRLVAGDDGRATRSMANISKKTRATKEKEIYILIPNQLAIGVRRLAFWVSPYIPPLHRRHYQQSQATVMYNTIHQANRKRDIKVKT